MFSLSLDAIDVAETRTTPREQQGKGVTLMNSFHY